MENGKQIKDYLRIGTHSDVREALSAIINTLSECELWIQKQIKRTDTSVILTNIIRCTKEYVEISNYSESVPVQVVALSTRGIYELNLRLRKLLDSEDYRKYWQSETVYDKIKVLEALIEYSEQGSDIDKLTLQEEIVRLNTLLMKYNLPSQVKQPNITELARSVGLESENRAFFKLYSKIVHPSAWLVNDTTSIRTELMKNIFLIKLQIYAWDTFSRIIEYYEIPESEIIQD